MFPDMWKSIAVFDSFQASPARPLKTNIKINMRVEC